MGAIITIARKELSTFFDSLIAYILIIVFLGLSGFFTWLYGADVFLIGQASIGPFFSISYWTLFFFIPAITMKMLAEENRSGTIELLLTKAVTDWQVVVGKFMACLALVGIALLFSLPYYFTIAYLGPVDHGAIICGYIGLLLMSSMYIGIGLMCSSLTKNQIVAFMAALLIGIFFLILFGQLANVFRGGLLGDVFYYLDIRKHFDAISRGVIDTKNIVYFGSITILCLFLTQAALSKRNIVE